MLKSAVLLFVLSQITVQGLHFYRRDYTYFEEYDAYYKLHPDQAISWYKAFIACEDEGAKLFYPKQDGEWKVVKNLTTAVIDGNISDILIGIHDEIGLGEFVTVDGQPTPTPLDQHQLSDGNDCVLMNVETGDYKLDKCTTEPPTSRSFVCRKVDDKRCPTIDVDYSEYQAVPNKCYKVNNRKRTWQEAWQTCYMEGGMLAVPMNVKEAELIRDIISDGQYFAGFKKIIPTSDFYNVRGTRLQDGYELWFDKKQEDMYDCGTVYKYNNQLYTRSLVCGNKLAFICEMNTKN